MPELPDVEIYKRYLDRTALGQSVEDVAVNDARILAGLSADEFVRRLKGRRFEHSRRHGKHLLVRLSEDGWLTLHFGMTGTLAWFENLADEPPYDRVRFDFARGHLGYVNRRMLGRVGLTEDAEAFISEEELGPDALDPAFDLEAFKAVLRKRRRDLKSVLMDQSLFAGVGNIYADEILFQARLHPKVLVERLDERQIELVFRTLKEVFETAVACGAGSEQFQDRMPRDYLLPHREKGAKCPRCGTPIATLKSGGRTSYYCPSCQGEGG